MYTFERPAQSRYRTFSSLQNILCCPSAPAWPQIPTDGLSGLMDQFCLSWIPCNWNYTDYTQKFYVRFSLFSMFWDLSLCSMYQYFIPLYCWNVFHCIDILQFIHSPVDGYSQYFQFEAMMNKSTHICVQAFFFNFKIFFNNYGYVAYLIWDVRFWIKSVVDYISDEKQYN